MNAPEFPRRQREGHLIGGIEAGEDRVGGLDQAAHALRIDRLRADVQRVADGGDVGVVHRLVGFRLDGDFDVLVVVEHGVDRIEQPLVGVEGVFGFADIGAFSRGPQHDFLRTQFKRDVDAALRSIRRVLPHLRVVCGPSAVNRVGMFP